MGRTTIKDVSRAAGVAASTVSRVMNGSGYTSEETRQRVLQAITELGFEPSRAARTLITGRTGTIALVLPDITNPFFPALARGVEDAASAQGYMVLLCNTDSDVAQEQAYCKLLREQRVDGVVLSAGSPENEADWVRLAQQLPLVLIDRRFDCAPADAVLLDNVRGAYAATQHLIGLGHRRIAHISGPLELLISQDRRTGYEQAMSAAGLPVASSLIVAGDFRYSTGYTRMNELMATGVTAVFAGNDMMALGAMKAVQDAGRHVPHDVAVIGFDDIMTAAMVTPAMTTVSQPAYRMGVLAVDMLLARLAKGEAGEPQSQVLQPTLVLRDSCGGKGICDAS